MGYKPKLLDPPTPREDTLGFFFPQPLQVQEEQEWQSDI